MSATVHEMVGRIKALKASLSDLETKASSRHLEIGEVLYQLRKVVRSNSRWAQVLKDLGFDRRVAERYLKIGESWWPAGGLERTGLLPKLPADLHKLYWLCQLPKEELEACLTWGNGLPREALIRKVQEHLGHAPKPAPSRKATYDAVKKQCESLIDRVVDLVADAADEIPDPVVQRQLIDELMNKFTKVESVLGDDDTEEVGMVEVAGTGDPTESATPEPEAETPRPDEPAVAEEVTR